jgi:phosphoserine phosphatase
MTSPATLPQMLSTEEFEASVHALQPRIAVFDCDGTLWSGDAGSSFMGWTIEAGLLAPDKIAWLDDRYQGYKRGEVSELGICGEMVQVYAGLREADLRAAAAEFFSSHIEANIFPEMQRLIADLQRAGVDIWAVSSTNDWVVEEGVKRFNIPAGRVLAARVDVLDGIASDRILDVPTDEYKVAALARMGITAPDCVFGNSVHDAAMLAIARRAFPVNPSPALVERSAAEGWPVYYPASVRPA